MAIPRLNSQELNEILYGAIEEIEKTKEEVGLIKENIQEKMNVIAIEQEYAIQKVGEIVEKLKVESENNRLTGVENKVVFCNSQGLGGVFELYGETVHSRFLREPQNVFNLKTTTSYLFRDNTEVYINGENKSSYRDMLMAEGVKGKGITFEEFENEEILIEIEANASDILGSTEFNVIEIDPFLVGSFDIKALTIYPKYSEEEDVEPVYEINDMQSVGKRRIILPKKTDLHKVSIAVKINHKNKNGLYPFGMKSLQFLNADFNESSHVVIKVEKSHFINTVSNGIIIKDQEGKRVSTVLEEEIELYLNANNEHVLEHKIQPSMGQDDNVIARNSRQFFSVIPLSNKSLLSVEFQRIHTR